MINKQHIHKSSKQKQVNKPHKKHGTARKLKSGGRVNSNNIITCRELSGKNFNEQNKINRIVRSELIRKNKRDEEIKRKRLYGINNIPPKIILLADFSGNIEFDQITTYLDTLEKTI